MNIFHPVLADDVSIKAIIIIGALLYGAVANWAEKRKKKEAEALAKRIRENERSGHAGAPAAPVPAQPAAGGGVSEEERLRRFLEALGVPSGSARPAPPPPGPVLRPPMGTPTAPKPVAPVLRPAPAPRPRPVPAPPRPAFMEPRPVESQDPGRLEEPAAAIEATPDSIGMSAEEIRFRATGLPPLPGPPRKAAAAAMREALRSRESLRSAILLREVLGPPPGLG